MNSETREWATAQKPPSWCATHANRIVALVLALVSFGVGYYLYANSDGELHLGARDALGPSKTQAWYSSYPEAFDLRGEALIDAAERVKTELPSRDCVVVVKRGAVVHEEYYNGATMNSAFDSEEVGKIAVALVIGAAVHKELLTLDDKVSEVLARSGRGDTPEGWSAENWRALTVRHLLAQVSGTGEQTPGTTFANDVKFNDGEHSPLFWLNAVLRTATGEAPAAFASKYLTEPIGLANFFAHDDAMGGDISVVGGQMASCRDLARFGQLVVNDGRWKSTGLSVRRLVSKAFIHDMLMPSFPLVSSNFGFGGWVYNPKSRTLDSELAGLGVTDVSGLGQDCPVHAGPVVPGAEPRYPVLFSSGGLGKMMITIPSQKVIVVSLGSTWAASPSCPAVLAAIGQAELEPAERSPLPRNDLFAVQRLWLIIKPVIENKKVPVSVGALYRLPSYGSLWASLHHKTAPTPELASVHHKKHNPEAKLGAGGDYEYDVDAYDGSEASLGADPADWNNNMQALVNSIPADAIAESEAITHSDDKPVTWNAGDTKLYSGTCSCTCAPNLKIGQCFNVRNSLSNVCEDLGLQKHGARFCPALGVMNGCGKPVAKTVGAYGTTSSFSSDQMSQLMNDATISLINKQINPIQTSAADIEAKIFNCKVTKACDMEKHWQGEVSTLQCAPTGFSGCTFTPDTLCDSDSVKMPLVNVSVVQGSNEALVEMPTEGWVLQNGKHDVDGGDLGKDFMYSQLQVTSGHTESLRLIKKKERSLILFNAVAGIALILVGFAVVGRIKGHGNDDDSEEGEGLVKHSAASAQQYGTDTV